MDGRQKMDVEHSLEGGLLVGAGGHVIRAAEGVVPEKLAAPHGVGGLTSLGIESDDGQRDVAPRRQFLPDGRKVGARRTGTHLPEATLAVGGLKEIVACAWSIGEVKSRRKEELRRKGIPEGMATVCARPDGLLVFAQGLAVDTTIGYGILGSHFRRGKEQQQQEGQETGAFHRLNSSPLQTARMHRLTTLWAGAAMEPWS